MRDAIGSAERPTDSKKATCRIVTDLDLFAPIMSYAMIYQGVDRGDTDE